MFAGGDAIARALAVRALRPDPALRAALRHACRVVALTGGLADTVIDASPMALRTRVATGIQFHPVTAARAGTCTGASAICTRIPRSGGGCSENAMRQPVGWDASAAEYAALYIDTIEATMRDNLTIAPGRPAPLGATFDGDGVNFAVFSEHADAGRAVPVLRGRPQRGGADRPARAGRRRLARLRLGPAPGPELRLPRPRALRAPSTATASTPTSC